MDFKPTMSRALCFGRFSDPQPGQQFDQLRGRLSRASLSLVWHSSSQGADPISAVPLCGMLPACSLTTDLELNSAFMRCLKELIANALIAS
jgi:hypothetical protein